mmetsp:Transcript_738/g.1274  ORF Transcript_738/g.1274 Transcript_738/m.1274 type:complete len:645 (+) Transcript_738:81-2015(+)
MISLFITAVIVLLALCDAHKATYYLPGVTPHAYKHHDNAKLFVSKLSSTKTQIPYDYYSLPYCKPKKATLEAENLGQILSGERIENSVYELEVKVPKSCEVACVRKLKRSEKEAFVQAIQDDYKVHWMVDNLPVGMFASIPYSREQTFTRGFPVGFTSGTGRSAKHYLNNHVRIVLKYHDDVDSLSEEEPTTKIVGFRVEPMSIRHTWPGGDFVKGRTTLSTCNAMNSASSSSKNWLSVDKNGENTVVFTYDVVWEKSIVEWAERWDIYLNANTPNEKVHWFSITNSIMIVLFLTVMIAVILVRALRKDIAQYNDPSSLEEAKEESGWKLVHGDVFRPPATQPMLFSVFVGTGVQLCCMCVATLSFALLGLLSPANRGSLVTAFILLFVFMGSFAGYFSSSTYKMFRGVLWKQNTLMTAFFYPGIVFVIIFVLNLFLRLLGSSGAIPFGSLFTLLFLWFCVSVPLVFLGSFFGYKREIAAFPVRTNQIPRAIPQQQWYIQPIVSCLLGGVLPFGAVSVEMYFIMSALWLHQIYYIFGFLFLVMVVLLITCAEVSILLCYFQLLNEDYRWWWRSFLHSGSCAFYTALYAVWYHLTELEMSGVVPILLYYGYMSIICFTFFLITGTIGYFSCFWFNWQIYNSIKVD